MISAKTLCQTMSHYKAPSGHVLGGGVPLTHDRNHGRATSPLKGLGLSEHGDALTRRIRGNDGHEPPLGITWSSWDRHVVSVLNIWRAVATHQQGQCCSTHLLAGPPILPAASLLSQFEIAPLWVKKSSVPRGLATPTLFWGQSCPTSQPVLFLICLAWEAQAKILSWDLRIMREGPSD